MPDFLQLKPLQTLIFAITVLVTPALPALAQEEPKKKKQITKPASPALIVPLFPLGFGALVQDRPSVTRMLGLGSVAIKGGTNSTTSTSSTSRTTK